MRLEFGLELGAVKKCDVHDPLVTLTEEVVNVCPRA
jgi:hypothetical protein